MVLMQRVTADRPWPLHDTAATRRLEALQAAALPPHTLMQRAGRTTAELAMQLLHAATPVPRVLVVAGPGNNGGDALEAAATLAEQGIHVEILLVADPARYTGDAARACQLATDSAASFIGFDQFDGQQHGEIAGGRDCRLSASRLFQRAATAGGCAAALRQARP